MSVFPTLVQYWSLPDGSTATVTITVDDRALYEVVEKAVRNRGRRARVGPVEVKLTDFRPPVLRQQEQRA
jgi:hypothetical protein